MKAVFVVGTVNGEDLDWWSFSSLQDARSFIATRDYPERLGIVQFHIPEAKWNYGEYPREFERIGG